MTDNKELKKEAEMAFGHRYSDEYIDKASQAATLAERERCAEIARKVGDEMLEKSREQHDKGRESLEHYWGGQSECAYDITQAIIDNQEGSDE